MTFLELGEATSLNLEFSHLENVFVSYGEETITENNLLEIRRRHPRRVLVETFSKAKEGKNGADWQWHIVGQKLTLKMRVQAKRVQSDDKLRIKHKVKSSGKQQRDLLLDGARADNVKPLYCIYCTEQQRSFWTQSHPKDYQTGCLLADAQNVSETTTQLGEIERKCIPWHYLFEPVRSVHWEHQLQERVSSPGTRFVKEKEILVLNQDNPGREERWNAPTVADLNGEGEGDFDRTGVYGTDDEDRRILRSKIEGETYLGQEDQAAIQDRRVHRMLVIDVRPNSAPW